MAKAKAECTCSTCGSTFWMEKICRNRKDADSWETWAAGRYTLCDECSQKALKERREQESVEASAYAKENGWIALSGTEKQVAWAEKIRFDYIQCADKSLEEISGYIEENPGEYKARMNLISAYCDAIKHKVVDAYWWIENRKYFDSSYGSYYTSVEMEMAFMDNTVQHYGAIIENTDDSKEAQEAIQEMMISPENVTHDGWVEITIMGSRIYCKYPKDATFREICRNSGMDFDSRSLCWYLGCGKYIVSMEDMAAELGNRFLKDGFSVLLSNDNSRAMLLNGTFAVNPTRWIDFLDGRYCIKFPMDDDKAFFALQKLAPYARWSSSSKGYMVNISQYAAISDMERLFGFRLTKAANDEICKGMAAMHRADVVVPTISDVEYKDGLKDLLKADRGVIEDLVDDE